MDLKTIYKQDSSGAFIIEVALDIYSDIFNEWDPAPFKKRDIDQELKIFLEECSEDIPLKHPLKLSFNLPQDHRDQEKEKNAITGIKNYFKIMKTFEMRSVKRQKKKVIQYFFVSVTFLISAILMEKFFADKSFLLKLLTEGLFLGGWVMGWEGFSKIFFEIREIKHSLKEYERFEKSKIVFNYN